MPLDADLRRRHMSAYFSRRCYAEPTLFTLTPLPPPLFTPRCRCRRDADDAAYMRAMLPPMRARRVFADDVAACFICHTLRHYMPNAAAARCAR